MIRPSPSKPFPSPPQDLDTRPGFQVVPSLLLASATPPPPLHRHDNLLALSCPSPSNFRKCCPTSHRRPPHDLTATRVPTGVAPPPQPPWHDSLLVPPPPLCRRGSLLVPPLPSLGVAPSCVNFPDAATDDTIVSTNKLLQADECSPALL